MLLSICSLRARLLYRAPMTNNGLPPSEKFLLLGSFLLLALLAAWHLFSEHGILHYFRLQQQLTGVRQENAALQAENKALTEEIDHLRNDRDYFIDRARKEYGLIKKNEVIFDFSQR